MFQCLPHHTVLVSPSLEILRHYFPKERARVSGQGDWQGRTTNRLATRGVWRSSNCPRDSYPTRYLPLALCFMPSLWVSMLSSPELLLRCAGQAVATFSRCHSLPPDWVSSLQSVITLPSVCEAYWNLLSTAVSCLCLLFIVTWNFLMFSFTVIFTGGRETKYIWLVSHV